MGVGCLELPEQLKRAKFRIRTLTPSPDPVALLCSLEIGNVGQLQLNSYGFRVVLELSEETTAHDLASRGD